MDQSQKPHSPKLALPFYYISHHHHTAGPPSDILILLHGYGSHEEDLFSMRHELDPRFHIISLRAPRQTPWEGYAWFDIEFLPSGIKVDADQALDSLHLLITALENIKSVFPDSRLHLMGFSQGTIMSFGVALQAPKLISSVVGFSGRAIEKMIPNPPLTDEYAQLPIFQSHGTMDSVIPVQMAREADQLLKSLGFHHVYKEYPFQHEISLSCLSDARNWMKSTLFKENQIK